MLLPNQYQLILLFSALAIKSIHPIVNNQISKIQQLLINILFIIKTLNYMLLITLLAAQANGQKIIPQFSLLQKIGLTLAVGGALTIGGVLLAAQKISIGGRYLGKTIKNVVSKPYYFITEPFKKNLKIQNELSSKILTQEQASMLKEQIKKQIGQNSNAIYIVVNQSKGQKQKIVAAFDINDTVNAVSLSLNVQRQLRQQLRKQSIENKVLI